MNPVVYFAFGWLTCCIVAVAALAVLYYADRKYRP